MKVPHEENSKKKESLSKTYSISSGPDPGVKFTAIKGIKLQENPRQIIFPAHFDGHIQIDVGTRSSTLLFSLIQFYLRIIYIGW